jgi:hypothetical protein
VKTKDLIAALQEADPTGEEQVCVGNEDIHFVQREPAYYDGALQVLKRDTEQSCYNIVGVEYRRSGDKVQIHTLSAEWVILEDSEAPVTFDSDPPSEYLIEKVEGFRRKARELDEKYKSK